MSQRTDDRELEVIVVENSEFFCNWIQKEVNQIKGILVKGFTNTAEKANKMIIETKPDIVILDIDLDDGNGIDVLKVIRSEDLNTRVIIFTNYPWQVFQMKCLNLGADYFFDKSVDSCYLKEAIINIQNNYIQKNR